jgi:hypothetical protein
MSEKMGAKSIVMLIIALVVGLSMTPLIVSLINAAPLSQTTNQTGNPSFTDNTGANANYWDNSVQGQAVASLDTTNHWFTMTSTDNSTANIDNGILKQALVFSTSYDTLVSAKTTFTYRVYDNDNANSIVVRVYLDNGTDNITLYVENVTLNKSSSWTTVENNVATYFKGAGTYTLWIRVEMNGKGPGESGKGTNCVVNFDNASLTIVTASQSTNMFLYLIPLFYVIALVLGTIAYATGSFGKR